MEKREIINFLRCPAAELVDLAVKNANLTRNEQAAIELCARQGVTKERAAEEIDVSVDAMKKWYGNGMEKLNKAWSGSWWINKLAQ